MKRWVGTLMVMLCLAGCGGRAQQHPWGTLKECKDQNTDLSLQIQSLQTKNDQLTEQIATLSALNGKIRLGALDTLEKIRIGKYTDFYDKDENGTKETLIVYLEPLDTAQDYIKAIGKVNVQVWDLNAAAGNAKLAEWTVEPAGLHKNWGGTIFRGYYRLSFNGKEMVNDLLTKKRIELTLKITFTDYFTGKVLTDQKVISAQ